MAENGATGLRRSLFFSGTVQGVGFRYTTQAIASRFHVTGFVRNLADGRVELVAEGSQDEVERFQLAVEDALQRYIREISPADSPATGEFTSFSIAF